MNSEYHWFVFHPGITFEFNLSDVAVLLNCHIYATLRAVNCYKVSHMHVADLASSLITADKTHRFKYYFKNNF